MHERFRRFSLEGKIKDGGNWQRTQDDMRNILEDKMRSKGCVPNLDCGVHWSVDYDQQVDEHSFKISMYGVFVGKRKAKSGAVYFDERVHHLD